MAMFCTQEDVKEMTGYEVGPIDLIRAQTIIESYIGKIESDISNPRDRVILGRATAYQAAYMKDNAGKIYEQVALSQITQNGGIMTYKAGDDAAPFIAPLAVLALKHLSWRKSRSVRVGPILKRRGPGRWGVN